MNGWVILGIVLALVGAAFAGIGAAFLVETGHLINWLTIGSGFFTSWMGGRLIGTTWGE